eukprot:TRINITY_DN5045_c0_g1_i2.p1 TRINITY_DN5045_c0_g1~~TRINITY_DN5045_c0_g1_i2.p1  ORF type:complete len:376 (-),score=47.70 TRINITY_DN5045_c0_g1_i2:64-1167(-)
MPLRHSKADAIKGEVGGETVSPNGLELIEYMRSTFFPVYGYGVQFVAPREMDPKTKVGNKVAAILFGSIKQDGHPAKCDCPKDVQYATRILGGRTVAPLFQRIPLGCKMSPLFRGTGALPHPLMQYFAINHAQNIPASQAFPVTHGYVSEIAVRQWLSAKGYRLEEGGKDHTVVRLAECAVAIPWVGKRMGDRKCPCMRFAPHLTVEQVDQRQAVYRYTWDPSTPQRSKAMQNGMKLLQHGDLDRYANVIRVEQKLPVSEDKGKRKATNNLRAMRPELTRGITRDELQNFYWKDELEAFAKEHALKIPGSCKKPQLIRLLVEFLNGPGTDMGSNKRSAEPLKEPKAKRARGSNEGQRKSDSFSNGER